MIFHVKPVSSYSGGLFFSMLVLLLLMPAMMTSSAKAQSGSPPWRDPATGLMWTGADNGSGISWHQAMRFCNDSRAGGYSDWKLPTIEEVQTIFGGPENESGRHVRGPIRVSGWEWSSTPGEREGEGWVLDFGDGGRASVAAGDSGLNRALCVRSPPR